VKTLKKSKNRRHGRTTHSFLVEVENTSVEITEGDDYDHHQLVTHPPTSECVVIEINWDAVIEQLATKAMRSDQGVSSIAGGAIRLIHGRVKSP
jgi:hypothetical protein